MMKILVYLITFVLCVGLLASGVLSVIQNTDFPAFSNDLQNAMTVTVPPSDDKEEDPTTDVGEGVTTEPTDEDKSEEKQEEQNKQEPSDPPKTTEDYFGTIFDEYSEESYQLQEEAMKNIISSTIDVKDQESRIYVEIIDRYLDELYSSIGESKSDEMTPEELEQTRKEFVENEAPAYQAFLDMMHGISASGSNYNPTKAELEDSIEVMTASQTCQSTLEKISSDSEIKSTIQASVQNMDPTVLQGIEYALNENSNKNQNTANICNNLADLFGISIR